MAEEDDISDHKREQIERREAIAKEERTGEWLVNKAPEHLGDTLVVTTIGRPSSKDTTRTCPTDHPNIGENLLKRLLDLEEDQRVHLTMAFDNHRECWVIEDIR